MRIHSDSFEHGKPIPPEFAAGAADGFGGNRNPHLAWEAVPAGARSLALLCIDPDAPTDASLAGKAGVSIPVAMPRTGFVHWAMVDLAPSLRAIEAGSCSDGFVAGGKQAPPGPAGARQGLNDYTAWFAGDAAMQGRYRGYDGPYPPPNDLLVHRYFFRLFALDVDALAVPADFGGGDVLRAMQGHVLAETATYGTYTLNPAAAPLP